MVLMLSGAESPDERVVGLSLGGGRLPDQAVPFS